MPHSELINNDLELINKEVKPQNVVCFTFIGSKSSQIKVVSKFKLWMAAILNFPMSKS